MAGICTGQHGCPYQLTFCHIVADKDPTAQAVAHQQPPIRQAALVTGTPPISPESRARSWAHPRSHPPAFVYVDRYSDQCGGAGHGGEGYLVNYYPNF